MDTASNPPQTSLWQKIRAGVGVNFALSWLAVLITSAVFAPFLANTAPIFIIKNGQWFFPAFTLLDGEDFLFLMLFISVLVFYLLKRLAHHALSSKYYWGVSVVLLAVLGIGVYSINPPSLINYAQYRSVEFWQDVGFHINAPLPYSPTDYLRDYGNTALEAPLSSSPPAEAHHKSRLHLLGTDENGADVLSRMIHASRIALSIGLIATMIALVIGVVVGGLMGYFSGWVDMIGMRLVEIFEAIPTLFLLLTFVAFFGRNLYLMMVIIGITGWSGYARYTRAEFLKLRQAEFVQAAVVSGLPLYSILFRHMLPNSVAPLLVAMSFGVASAILAEATLSFLGLGLVELPSWGQMLNQAVSQATFNWWMALFPGGAIFLTVFSYTLLGEAIRDALDPTIIKRQS